jgi:hypothetical protein
MNHSHQRYSSHHIRSSPQRNLFDLPQLVRAEPIRGNEQAVVERRHTYHLAQETKDQRLDKSNKRSTSLSMRGFQNVSVRRCLECLEVHLASPCTRSSLFSVTQSLEALTELDDDIHAEEYTQHAIAVALMAMEKYKGSASLQRLCLRVLLLMPVDHCPSNASVKYALAAMRNHPRIKQIQNWGCQFLDDVLQYAGENVFRTFNAEGGIEIVLSASKTFNIEFCGSRRILCHMADLADVFAQADVKSVKSCAETRLNTLHAKIVFMRLQRDLLV